MLETPEKKISVDSLIENVRFGSRTVLDVAADGKSLTVEARKLHPEEPRAPKRAESPARAHEFHSAISLGDYLARYGGPNTVVFADATSETIFAVLDEKSANGFELVTMKPQVHPLWKPWAELAESVEVTEFAAFLALHRRTVVGGRDLALTLSQLRANVTIEAQHGRGRTAMNGLMVTTKVTNGSDQREAVDLPDSILVTAPLYIAAEAVTVELDLLIESNSRGEVQVVVGRGAVAHARVYAFEQMVQVIREKIAKHEGATLTLGKPKSLSWTYLKELGAS